MEIKEQTLFVERNGEKNPSRGKIVNRRFKVLKYREYSGRLDLNGTIYT
jgi:hypothetical protein